MIREFKNGALTQRVAVADHTNGGPEILASVVAGRPGGVVYCDPPWNPGIEKVFRTGAGVAPVTSFNLFLDGWCRSVVRANPTDVFAEQGVIPEHKEALLHAIRRCQGWRWPLQSEWVIRYGSKRADGKKAPNALLHFGPSKIATDPTDLSGEKVIQTVLQGLPRKPAYVIDQCAGLGMTSRVAHKMRLDFIGTELGPSRLERLIGWLREKGYQEAGR
jgi:hypothetical protein